MRNDLDGMTPAKWDSLTPAERDALRDNGNLSPQLVGLEGWRVEVTTVGDGTKWRFIVGKSTGWRPCHLEISRRSAHGGHMARDRYGSVRKLYKVR